MRFTLFISAALILTANASIIKKRAVPTGVEGCVSGLNEITKAQEKYNKTFSTLTKSNLSDINKLTKEAEDLDQVYELTKVYCCNLPVGRSSGDDGKALANAFNNYTTASTLTYNSILKQKTILNNDVVYNRVSSDFLQYSPADEFSKCLVSRVPVDAVSKTTPLVAAFQKSFNSVLTTFKVPFVENINLVTAPKLPLAASNAVDLAANSPLSSIK